MIYSFILAESIVSIRFCCQCRLFTKARSLPADVLKVYNDPDLYVVSVGIVLETCRTETTYVPFLYRTCVCAGPSGQCDFPALLMKRALL